jgi:hypothetical protein
LKWSDLPPDLLTPLLPGKSRVIQADKINPRDLDITYYRRNHVAPRVSDDGQVIYIRNFQGTSRGWGFPWIASQAFQLGESWVAIRVAWGTKHSWGSTVYFYEETPSGFERVTLRNKRIKELVDSLEIMRLLGEG